MARCVHIYDSGFQCVDETVEPTDLCVTHQKVVAFDPIAESPRKTIFRVGALVLLLFLLVPIFYTVTSIYAWWPREEAQGAW